jgi:penicillin amidase
MFMKKYRRQGWAIANAMVSLLVAVGVIYTSWIGVGLLPPLGSLLNPGTGIWTLAADAQTPGDQTLHLPGLNGPVQVSFETNGIPHVNATTDHDLFMTIGYLHAKFRLSQMDLIRRQGEGLLSAIVGSDALSSDEFEDELGLMRTAQAEWAQMAPNSQVGMALLAYAQGVNAGITEGEQANNLPLLFKLLNYQPAPWTPVDTLVIQEVMTQTLDFSTGALDSALLVKSLGYQRTMQWFPIVPLNEQHPYDPGPYQQDGVALLAGSQDISEGTFLSASDLSAKIHALPTTLIHHLSNSNNWVVDGTKTASGLPLMAGDPHLDQTLPAIWYQLDAHAPHYQFAGVSIPGTPVILIGRNAHISWSLTDTQNQATFYYQEKTDSAHPGQYFWKGAWREMEQIHYTIPIKGGDEENLTVNLTVHGPIMTQVGQTMAVWWVGSLPSPDIQAMLNVLQASNFQQFREALRGWIAPSQNFVYADDQGNIGLISPGYYPQVASGQPWLPLPGTGEADVIGTIPFDDLPQVYNPPDHFLLSANQRIVDASYPYYIGTAFDFFDPGYRADQIYHTLSSASHLTIADMERLQNDTHDYLAQVIVPKLLDALGQDSSGSGEEQMAISLLRTWDGGMTVDSVQATIWDRFWRQYIFDTFHPWWDHFHVPQNKDDQLAVMPDRDSSATIVLGEDLQAWTLNDPTNPAFSLPNGTARTASVVMRQAFTETITVLTKELGPDLKTWAWGNVHVREFPSLTQIPSLGYGPRPSGGDDRTVNAADGERVAQAGPSWRFIMDWGTGQALGVYPGGQSENPLSPWYENQIPAWWDGQYYPMYMGDQIKSLVGVHTWTLQP